MKKNNIRNYILYISASSFLLVALLVGFNLYHAAVSSTIDPDLQIQIVPIDPSFNTQVIQKLKTRLRTQPVYELNNTSSEAATLPSSLPPQQTPISSQAGNVTPINPLERAGQ